MHSFRVFPGSIPQGKFLHAQCEERPTHVAGIVIASSASSAQCQVLLSEFERDGAVKKSVASFKAWCTSLTLPEGSSILLLYKTASTLLLCGVGDVSSKLFRGNRETVLLTKPEKRKILEGPLRVGDVVWCSVGEIPAVTLDVAPTLDSLDALVSANASQQPPTILLSEGPSQVVPVASRPSFSTRMRLVVRDKRAQHIAGFLMFGVVLGGIFFGSFAGLEFVANRGREQQLAPLRVRLASLQTSQPSKDVVTGIDTLRSDIQKLQNTSHDQQLNRSLFEMLSQAEILRQSLTKETLLEKLHVFYDFRLIAPDFVASSTAYDSAGKLAVYLDTTHKKLLSLSLEKKEATVLSVDERLTNPVSVAVDNRKAYVLASNGVMEASLPLDVAGSIVIGSSDLWQHPTQMDVFHNFAYVLDSGARNVYKYSLDDPQASPSAWLKDKEALDFDAFTKLHVDGNLWLSDTHGEVLRFTQGSNDHLKLHGLFEAPTQAVSMYLAESTKQLYVLEPLGKRLMVFSKDGEFVRSIVSPDFATTTGLIVDESRNRAYVLAGSLVFEVEL